MVRNIVDGAYGALNARSAAIRGKDREFRGEPATLLEVVVPWRSFTVREFGEAGVKRVSLAMSLFRHAMKAARLAAEEVRDHGSFGYLDRP